MKLVVATFSLLVLLALSGSIIALVDGQSGHASNLIKEMEKTLALNPKSGISPSTVSATSVEMADKPEGWVKALRCWSEIEAPADCPQW